MCQQARHTVRNSKVCQDSCWRENAGRGWESNPQPLVLGSSLRALPLRYQVIQATGRLELVPDLHQKSPLLQVEGGRVPILL